MTKQFKDPYDKKPNPLDIQVGGGHYTSMAIQPIEYAMANKLNACEFNVLKYISRQKKNRIEDLEKAKHCIDLLIGFETKKQDD